MLKRDANCSVLPVKQQLKKTYSIQGVYTNLFNEFAYYDVTALVLK